MFLENSSNPGMHKSRSPVRPSNYIL